ncbi:hypothetical protein [Paraburkholderia hospita]|uniref:hypothetical protein n=1 Tax=Paraburkholderia hospita TaxID=169430 RepID=UPI0008A7530E|nr:hypothetical protein [Paraburkholderia hospita]SEI21574.1 hypothetical protein SAMN05192544_104069 [Paraburkholderia hospita]
MSRLIIGRWESPWPSEPYLAIRLAIDVQDRKIVILHHFVEQSWIPFEASDDEYVRNEIADQLDMVIEDPKSYGMRRADEIPAAWRYDEAHPGEVNIGCSVPIPAQEQVFDSALAHSGRRKKSAKTRQSKGKKH